MEGDMEPVARTGQTASGQRAASQPPTVAEFLAAFAAAATVATSQDNVAGVAGSEGDGNESAAVAWLDGLKVTIRYDQQA
jgi:hypothetical protein